MLGCKTYLRYVKLQHVLNSVLERNHGAGTAGARTLHFQLDDAIFKSLSTNKKISWKLALLGALVGKHDVGMYWFSKGKSQ